MSTITEVKGNLFNSPKTSSLAHCVSVDLEMSKGIASGFKKLFGKVDELTEQKCNVGEVAILEENGRYIYYLVIKRKYYHKPTYESLEKTLVAMREHCIENNVSELSIPRIGCGLDRLKWSVVIEMIKNIFDININIKIYVL